MYTPRNQKDELDSSWNQVSSYEALHAARPTASPGAANRAHDQPASLSTIARRIATGEYTLTDRLSPAFRAKTGVDGKAILEWYMRCK